MSGEQLFTTEERLARVREIAHRRAHDPALDIRLGAFAAFMTQVIDSGSGPPYQFMEYAAHHRPDISSSHFLTKLLRSGQARFYQNYPGYPHDMTTPDAWRAAYRWLYEPEQLSLAAQFEVDFLWHPLQSNVSERYKSPKALATVLHKLGRLPVLSMVDVGCSQNMGAKHIVSQYGFRPATIIRSGSVFQNVSPYHSAAFNELSGETIPLGLIVGIDQYDPRASYDWAYACSFNPSELLDLSRVAMYDALITQEYDNVAFFRGDFNNFDDGDGQRFDARFAGQFSRLYGPDGELLGTDPTQYDQDAALYNFSAVLYQWGEPEREHMLEIAKRRAREGVIVTDFLSVVDGQLVIRDDWDATKRHDFPFTTAFWDKRADNPHWQVGFEWREGRVEEGRIGHGRIVDGWVESRSVFSVVDAVAKSIKRNRELRW